MDKPLARILVVDDDDEIRSLLQVVLTREDFDVQLAKDAPAARKILGARNGVDLIILDIMMPGLPSLSASSSDSTAAALKSPMHPVAALA